MSDKGDPAINAAYEQAMARKLGYDPFGTVAGVSGVGLHHADRARADAKSSSTLSVGKAKNKSVPKSPPPILKIIKFNWIGLFAFLITAFAIFTVIYALLIGIVLFIVFVPFFYGSYIRTPFGGSHLREGRYIQSISILITSIAIAIFVYYQGTNYFTSPMNRFSIFMVYALLAWGVIFILEHFVQKMVLEFWEKKHGAQTPTDEGGDQSPGV